MFCFPDLGALIAQYINSDGAKKRQPGRWPFFVRPQTTTKTAQIPRPPPRYTSSVELVIRSAVHPLERDGEASHFIAGFDIPHDAVQRHVWGTRQSRCGDPRGGFAVCANRPGRREAAIGCGHLWPVASASACQPCSVITYSLVRGSRSMYCAPIKCATSILEASATMVRPCWPAAANSFNS